MSPKPKRGDPRARPPQPPPFSCGKCTWVWVEERGEWLASWNTRCPVHLKPSDL